MKTVRSNRPDLSVAVPVRGGLTVKFTGHLSTVPGEVADTLCAMSPAHFRIVASEIRPGARVLVIRELALGDVLMTTPLIRALKARYKAGVDVAVHPTVMPALLGNPNIENILATNQLDRRGEGGYDAVIDLNMVVEHAESQGIHEHRVKAFGHVADIDLVTAGDLHLDYFVTDDEKAEARETLNPKETLKRTNVTKTIAYIWRASMDNRSWDAAQHAAVIAALTAKGYSVAVLHHSRVDLPLSHPGVLNLTGQTTLRETAAIISLCDACVTPDTGAYHLAAALDVPAVAYFGAMPAAERTTHTVPLEVLNREGVCGLLPCRQYRCLHPEKSAGGMPPCLSVPPGSVADAVTRVMMARKIGMNRKRAA